MRGLAIWVALWERCAPALIIQNTAAKSDPGALLELSSGKGFRIRFHTFRPSK